MPNRHGQDDDYRYGFNGMEKDDEVRGTKGASYDFGARMLDVRIGRWLSGDPHEKKYPSYSTYNFVVNNPLIYIDPDGKDYEIYIDHDNKTIIIKASFKTLQENENTKALVAHGVGKINDENGNFKYVVGKGKDAQIYDVSFEITDANANPTEDGKPVSQINLASVVPDKALNKNSTEGKKVEGINENDRVYIGSSVVGTERGKDVTFHEMVHALGVVHSNAGIMTSTGSGEGLVSANITSILGRAGFGKRDYLATDSDYEALGKATKIEEKGENANFNKGKVVTSRRAKRIKRRKERKLAREEKRQNKN